MQAAPVRFAGLAVLLSLQVSLSAQTLIYDRATFQSDPAASSLASINFDSFLAGTDLTNQTILGATFTAPGASPLLVITGSSGVRYPMSPSSGLNVLSPGGNNPSLEQDDLEITFASPVRAAGLDVVFDVPDGASYVGASFYDLAGNLLAQNTFIPAPNGAPGYQFVGFIASSSGPWIKRIVFNEFDGSANDDNVAYDSLVYTAPAVPEPATYALLPLGLIVLLSPALCRRHVSAA